MKNLDKKLNRLPDKPGVYFFKQEGSILYVGKATSLRDRVKSYFNNDLSFARGPKITKMIEEADGIDWEETNSVLEALILEANLIKKYQPVANTLGKDNKSYNHVVITDEEYPRVVLVREHDLQYKESLGFDIKYQFGLFPQASQLKEALKIVRKIFPFRGEKDVFSGLLRTSSSQRRKAELFFDVNNLRLSPSSRAKRRDLGNEKESVLKLIFPKRQSTLNIELGLTPDFSVVSYGEYQKTIRNIKMFFDGKKDSLIKKLEKEMKDEAKKQNFEKAEKIKRQIFALSHIQDIALLKEQSVAGLSRIEAYDVAHLSGTNKVGVMTVIENGMIKSKDYRKFNIKEDKGGDTGALREILTRRLNHNDWPLPKLIVVDGGKAQKNTAKKVLAEFGYQISVVATTKDDKHRVKGFLGDSNIVAENERDILLANSEAHRFAIKFHKQKRTNNFK